MTQAEESGGRGGPAGGRGGAAVGALDGSVPGAGRLAGAFLVAFLLAVLMLLVVILPAGYSLDPLGTGAWLGIEGPSGPQPVQYREDTVQITVPAGGGVEYKLFVQEGDEFRYEWTAGALLYYDFHGEREGDTSGDFTSHEEGRAGFREGNLTAPFSGTHGWYWQNDTDGPVTLELETRGRYRVVGLLE